MSKILDLLLRPETPDVQKNLPRGSYEVVRLSKLYQEPFVLELKGLPYGKALELRDMEDAEIQTVLAGDASGVWRSSALLEAHGPTPAEAVKSLLLPGEIRSVSIAVEQLSGYRKEVVLPWGREKVTDAEDAVAEELEKN